MVSVSPVFSLARDETTRRNCFLNIKWNTYSIDDKNDKVKKNRRQLRVPLHKFRLLFDS